MSVGTTDIKAYKSASGSSDGGAISGVLLTDGLLNDQFADVNDAQRIAGYTFEKAWFLKNEHGTDSMALPSVWIQTIPTGCTEYLGVHVDAAGATDKTQGNMTAFGVADFLAAISDGADTRTLHIVGLDSLGDPAEEDLVLTGAVEVLSLTTWTVVYAVQTTSSGSRTVLVKQGAGGTTRGTIGTGKLECWLWVIATSKVAGLRRVDLVAGGNIGIWDRIVVAPAAPGVRPDDSVAAWGENA